MIKLIAYAVSLCLASPAAAQPQDYWARRSWLDQHQAQDRKKQLDLQNRQRAQQQQQLNQERARAEHGWQLHPRPGASWQERQREYELKREFQRP
jgi:hypothetical protein